MAQDLFELFAEWRAQRRPFAIATVVETEGSVSAKTAAKAMIDARGCMVAGWVGGGCAESAVCEAASRCIEQGTASIIDIEMNDEVLGVGMPCGGSMRVYIEPVVARSTVWIMGHGRIAEALSALAEIVGFEVVVNDPAAVAERYPAAARLIADDLDYAELRPSAGDFVVIATQHKGDHESIRRALASEARYIALIASRKRAALVMEYLRQAGTGAEQLARVRSPAGLDLGARTPEEIALCVLSEIVMLQRNGSGRSLAESLVLAGVAAEPRANSKL